VAPDIAGLAAGVAVCLDAPADSVRMLAAKTATAPAAIAALTISVQRRAFIPPFVHPAHPEWFQLRSRTSLTVACQPVYHNPALGVARVPDAPRRR
jgi:hypothetical protein